jgi:hypothetical protein
METPITKDKSTAAVAAAAQAARAPNNNDDDASANTAWRLMHQLDID